MYEIKEKITCCKNFFMPSNYRPYKYIAKKAPEDRGGPAFIYRWSCTCQVLCCCRPALWVYLSEKQKEEMIVNIDDEDSEEEKEPK